ncbi:hypothetical protein ACXGQW_11180 [Wenyingzhuangia sp. IMCC45533]
MIRRKKHRYVALLIIITLFVVAMNGGGKTNPNDSIKMMKIQFTNIQDSVIKNSFHKVFSKYKNLHQYHIELVQKNMGSTTMQAQPKISFSSLFNGVKSYKIEMGIYLKDTDIKLSEVPSEVLQGWFAHELGHVEDYEQHSNSGMLWYGIRYFSSKKFKKKVEHNADYIAFKRGFRKELIATKKYILYSELFTEKYLKNINTYYLPLETLEKMAENDDDIDSTELLH